MADKNYITQWGDDIEIHYRIVTEKGKVVYFVIQMVYIYKGEYYQIVRYDNAHGTPHKHCQYKKPHSKEYFDWYTNEEVIAMAKEDLNANYEIYIQQLTERLT